LVTWGHGQADTTKKRGKAGKFQEKNGVLNDRWIISNNREIWLVIGKFGLL